MDEVISYRYLSNDTTITQELSSLQSHLLALLDSGQATTSSVTVLEKKFQQLKTTIDQDLENQALQHAIQTAAHDHLQAMGYRLKESQMSAESTWAVPGGEQVKMRLQPDHRLAFSTPS